MFAALSFAAGHGFRGAGAEEDLAVAGRNAGHTIQTLENHYRRWIPEGEAEFAAAVEGQYADLRADSADSTRALRAV